MLRQDLKPSQRNIERWQKASEAEIADYFDQCIAKAEAEARAKAEAKAEPA